VINTIRNAAVEFLFWLIARIGLQSDMHRYGAIVWYSAEDACYIATSPEWRKTETWKYIHAFGPTAHKALYEFGIVLQMAVEVEQEDGRPLPAEEAQP
jgi:predicted RNase H-like HicB family nuclease